MKLEIDLNKIELDEYGETVASVIRDEIKCELRSQIKKALKENKNMKQAVSKLTSKAASDLLNLVQ